MVLTVLKPQLLQRAYNSGCSFDQAYALQVLSPQYGEQIKGDFAEAPKIGEVDLGVNSTVKLTGLDTVLQPDIAGVFEHGLMGLPRDS